MYYRTNVLCCKERSPQKKKILKLEGKGKKYSSRFYSAMIAVIQKVHFCCVLLLHSPWWWRGVCESWLFDTRLSQQIGRSRLGYDGSASRTFNAPVLTTIFNSAKISLLVFLYRDFGERIEDPPMFYFHQWSCCETRDYLSVIILKSHLTLQVILPTRASLVTPSLIDDSARPQYYKT